jgi:hypothetical protein
MSVLSKGEPDNFFLMEFHVHYFKLMLPFAVG